MHTGDHARSIGLPALGLEQAAQPAPVGQRFLQVYDRLVRLRLPPYSPTSA
ncbi:MAG: hypothetical protein ABIR67_10915 [Gaiellaceae bacterium]